MKLVAAQWLSTCWNSSGDDETFQDIFRDFSDMASHDPERLSRRQFSRGGDEEEEGGGEMMNSQHGVEKRSEWQRLEACRTAGYAGLPR